MHLYVELLNTKKISSVDAFQNSLTHFFFYQFNSVEEGTPVNKSGFCGLWSLKNAQVLFKNSYNTDSGATYGPVSLDLYPIVRI